MRRLAMPIFGTFMLVPGTTACTALPTCPDAQLSVIEAGDGRLYVFDEPNWQRAVATLRGLNEGACRLSRPDERASPPEPVRERAPQVEGTPT